MKCCVLSRKLARKVCRLTQRGWCGCNVPCNGSLVPIRDLQGHAYNAKDMRVRFSEPSLEPNSDSKIRLLLDDAVHSTEPLISLEFDQKKSLSKGTYIHTSSWYSYQGFISWLLPLKFSHSVHVMQEGSGCLCLNQGKHQYTTKSPRPLISAYHNFVLLP